MGIEDIVSLRHESWTGHGYLVSQMYVIHVIHHGDPLQFKDDYSVLIFQRNFILQLSENILGELKLDRGSKHIA